MTALLIDNVVVDIVDTWIHTRGFETVNLPEGHSVKRGYIYDAENNTFLEGDYGTYLAQRQAERPGTQKMQAEMFKLMEDYGKLPNAEEASE